MRIWVAALVLVLIVAAAITVKLLVRRRAPDGGWFTDSSRQVPLPLWLVLGIGGSLTLAYMCAQADRREGLLIPAIPIGFFSTMVTAALLVVFFLDHPYTNETGGIAPTEMQRSLTLIDHGSDAPCDERGIPGS